MNRPFSVPRAHNRSFLTIPTLDIHTHAWGIFGLMKATRNKIPRIGISLLIAGLLVGCVRSRPSDVVPAETPSPVEPAPRVVPPTVPEKHEAHGPETHWPQLFLAPADAKASDIKFTVDHLAITEQEYNSGLLTFAKTYAGPASNLEDAYRDSLREELLLLCYLRDVVLEDNPHFEDEARSALRAQLAQLLIQKELEQTVRVTEQDIFNSYQKNVAQYTQPQRVSIRVIMVPTNAEAQSVLERLDAGEDFSALAREVSVHSSRDSGGQIDPFSRGTYSSSFEELAFQLKTGERGTLDTSRGVLIMEKIAESAQTMTPLDEVRDQIREKLLEEKRLEARREFLQRLEERAELLSRTVHEPKSVTLQAESLQTENSTRADEQPATQ